MAEPCHGESSSVLGFPEASKPITSIDLSPLPRRALRAEGEGEVRWACGSGGKKGGKEGGGTGREAGEEDNMECTQEGTIIVGSEV